MEYARWLEDDTKHMTELQAVLQPQIIDANLGAIVEECMRHYDELFHLRAMLARSDVFHLMTGLWATTAERCFLWMGGFRPSEILKVGVKLMQKHPFLSLFFQGKAPTFSPNEQVAQFISTMLLIADPVFSVVRL
jgi:hypothetical protein